VSEWIAAPLAHARGYVYVGVTINQRLSF
jgi:hypothetical protein